jgi:CubicO group peptidase (beta-lactamase class C family)
VQLTPGVDDGRPLPTSAYPRGRRPSGGLCSTAEDLLAFGERLLARADVLDQVRALRTGGGDPMRYGFGWALGPSGQMYLNGRLPGYRTALVLVPNHHLVSVALAADSGALPAAARVLSDLQHRFTGDDLAADIDAFAA